MDLAQKFAALPKKNQKKNRIVIITCGPNSAKACEYSHKDKKIISYIELDPELVDVENIVDLNGAGDAFAGGFLAYHSNGYSLENSVRAGHLAASLIIQTRGCQVPKTCDFQVQVEQDDN